MRTALNKQGLTFSPVVGEAPLVIGLILVAWFLRTWQLESKGLWYDEAATALMAQASHADIVRFHWTRAFEHPPVWALMMNGWLKVFGRSEAALRMPAVMAGALTVPLLWAIVKRLYPGDRAARLSAAALVALAPVLLEYGQEARMYSLAVALGMLSLYALLRMTERRTPVWAIVWVCANWTLTGLHYYIGATLLLSEALLLLLAMGAVRRFRVGWLALLAASAMPLVLWVSLSPGFRVTAAIVADSAQGAESTYLAFLQATWRDLTMGSLRAQQDSMPFATAGYLLLPFVGLGAFVASRRSLVQRGGTQRRAAPVGLLLIVTFLGPWLYSMVRFPTLQTRYILHVVPSLYALAALGAAALWRTHRLVGVVGYVVIAATMLPGVAYYFADYQKSEYREMAVYLRTHIEGASVPVLMEAPRQHLLAKYYLRDLLNLRPVPDVPLPEFWPVTAPQIVPREVAASAEAHLEAHGALWLILTAEDEVDPGGFLPTYLSAVAHPIECSLWLDVRLCHYLDPVTLDPALDVSVFRTFASELLLERAELGITEAEGSRHLLISLTWHALREPTRDYKVTIRVLDPSGQVIAQNDDFPIGPLLPPTTWSEGDVKPGYRAIALSGAMPEGTYQVVVGLYDPVTLAPVPHTTVDGATAAEFVHLATIRGGSVIEFLPASNTRAGWFADARVR